MKKQVFNKDHLHAYVDDQLSEKERQRIEALMQKHPHIAKYTESLKQQNKAIQSYYHDDRFEQIPDRLDPHQLSQKNVSSGLRSHFPRVATVILTVFFSGLLGWYTHSFYQKKQTASLNFVGSAISAYQVYAVEVRHPVEVKENERVHLAKWLSKRLDYELTIPQLEGFGYQLLGGRLLSMQGGHPGAQFMYENSTGQRVTILVSRNSNYQNSAFQFKKMDEINSFYWVDESVAFSITGEIDHQALFEITKAIYQQITEPFLRAEANKIAILGSLHQVKLKDSRWLKVGDNIASITC